MNICQHFQTKQRQAPFWRWLLLLALFCWGGLFACSSSLGPSIPPPKDKEVGIGLCESNSDCLAGQVCLSRYCRTPGGLPGEQIVSLYAIPPANHRYSDAKTVVTSQQFLGVDASKLHDKSIFLRSSYFVEGSVHATHTGKAPNEALAVESRIRFIDRESIPGNQLEVVTESDADGKFKARLTHGVYEVEITPKDGKHPPHRIPKVNVERDGELPLLIPEDESYPRLSGRIVTPDTTETPIAGLKIQVFSSIGKPISSVSTTDKDGLFQLWLSAKENPHLIRIHMRLEERDDKKGVTTTGHPQIDIPFAPASLTPGEKIDLGALKVGYQAEGASIGINGTISATQQHAAGQPLKGCEVHLVGTIDLKTTYKEQPIVGYYRVSTISQDKGYYSANVLPGVYQIDVLPSFDNREVWARASVQQDIFFALKDGINIELKPKSKVTGHICQKGDKGQCIKDIAEAQIQAVWRSPLSKPIDLDKRPPIPLPEIPTQLSEKQGRYMLPLDPGIYDLIFVPPVDSGLARRIRFNVRVEATDTPQNIDTFLYSANHLTGTILGPDRFPIQGTVIEMYSHPKDPNEPVLLLGRAITNRTGDFSIAYHIPTKD